MNAPDTLSRTVADALPKDAGRGIARLDPDDLTALGVDVGDVVSLAGPERRALAKALPTHPEQRGNGIVQCDHATRENAGVSVGGSVSVAPAAVQPAERVVLRSTAAMPSDRDLDRLGRLVDGLPVQSGDLVRATLFGGRRVDLHVETTRPPGGVIIQPETRVQVKPARGSTSTNGADAPAASGAPAYEDIGGLGDELQRIRETVELPLRRPDLFARLGIAPPTGILLAGPPGCGKTLLARTIAAESDAAFYSISGPEIIRKHYGESEAQVRTLFQKATKNAPALVFIDEIDAIAPRREDVEGDVEKRVVATLLTLMDGLEARRNVVVIAATNRPNAIDPALRRAGRFDRELHIPIPDRTGRAEILAIHSRGMPLDDDVDLAEVARITHGYVGADLEALCREAAMAALRRLRPERRSLLTWTPDAGTPLSVCRADFQAALRDVQATATREVFTEIPDVRWGDIGGLDDAKQRLTEAVEWPLAHPGLFAEADVAPPRGVLLAGPPGCGKTLLAQAVATETEANFISVKGPELLSKYVGTSEERVREVFRKAREAAPCIVFFDEVDALAPIRSDGAMDSGVASRVLAQVLTEMDGIEGLDGVVILGATNRLDRLDPALLRPGRFDEIVRIDRPNADARRAILRIHLQSKPLAPSLSDAVDALLARTDGFSGAECAAVCHRAALDAMRRHLTTSEADLVVTHDDLTNAAAHVGAQRRR